jgi:hypothetical protein
VGANRAWSAAGRRLFGSALGCAQLVHAAVRDQVSQEAWRDLLEPQGIAPAARLPRGWTALRWTG